MGRFDNDNWLDEALDEALASHDTRPDFNAWQASHPEAVEQITTPATPQAHRQPIRSTNMNSLFVKLAAAAAIAIAAIVGVYRMATPERFISYAPVKGPITHKLKDGSTVELGQGAEIIPAVPNVKRGFTHVAGAVAVTVAKGKDEFVVTTPYGDVTALGTQFTLDLVDGVAENTNEKVQLLSVEVTEGKVEVSNDKGSSVVGASQKLVVAADAGPYDFAQDETLPAGLKDRVGAMVAAFEAGDPAAWAANFNYDYVYRLAKGEESYDPQRFGGDEEDLERIRQAAAKIESPEQLKQMFLASINLTEPHEVYVRSVTLNDAGDHATAECITRKSANSLTITSPQWHYFDNAWWQIDD